MGFEHLYGRIVIATLGTLLGVCALLAGAKFIRNRAKLLSLFVRAHGALFAVLMGTMAAVGVFRGFAKLPQNYGIMELWNYGNEALGIDGEAQFHNASLSQLYNSIISESDISNGWRVVETRDSREIVRCDSFAAPQIHTPWLARGGYKDKTRIVPYGWTFPWRDGTIEGITVFSEGELRVNVHTNYFPQPFDAPLAVVPSFNWNLLPGGVSNVFWHAVSPSNSLVVTWENSPVNHDVNCITNFQAELFADGSFEYRYDDRTVGYAPVSPFDWDGDGLENSVDPEPLVAGPDAHGTNVEWYNVVCADIVNSNAYYFVDVVAEHGPVLICFNADRESLLGSPIVIARGGETNHVPLLMGVEYAATATVPFSVSAPTNAIVTINGLSDGHSFNIKWPLSFDLSPDNDGYAVGVQPFDPGGAFSWTLGLSGGACPRLLSGGSSCSFTASGNWVGFTGCGDCECGGCSIDGIYTLEGASFTVPSVWCGCAAVGPVFPGMPQFLASVSVNFDKAIVFYEDAYTNAPNVIVGRHSTTNVLSVSAYGGESGGLLLICQQNMDKLRRIGGADITFPYLAMLPPRGSVSFFVEYEAARHSDAEDDISVDVLLTPIGGSTLASASASNTVVKVQLEAIYGAPLDGNTSRHWYGVGELVQCRNLPPSVPVSWESSSGHILDYDNGYSNYESPLQGGECTLTASAKRESYATLCKILEPEKFYCERVTKIDFGLGTNEAGGVGMLLELHIAPRTVSFGNIAMQEVPTTTGQVGGYFLNEVFSNEWAHTREHLAGGWYNIGSDNLFMPEDEASLGLNLKRMTPDGVLTNDVSFGWQEGIIIWSIPLGWNEHNTSGDDLPARTNAVPEQQKFVIQPNGTVAVVKAGWYVIRGTNTQITTGRIQE